MASGKLAAAAIPATTQTNVVTIPDCIYSEVDIDLVNTSASAVTVKIYLTTAASPVLADAISYGDVIPANGGLFNKSGIKASPGEKIFIEPSGTGIVARITHVAHTIPV